MVILGSSLSLEDHFHLVSNSLDFHFRFTLVVIFTFSKVIQTGSTMDSLNLLKLNQN